MNVKQLRKALKRYEEDAEVKVINNQGEKLGLLGPQEGHLEFSLVEVDTATDFVYILVGI